MKPFGRLYVLIFSILLAACPLDKAAREGTLVIQNKSYDSNLEITDAWVKTEGSMEWVNQWHGICRGDPGLITDLSFTIGPGSYSVKLRVTEYGIVPRYYETPYMQPLRIGFGEYKFIIFDGQGIYDMERESQ
jgi:hypothetical protein